MEWGLDTDIKEAADRPAKKAAVGMHDRDMQKIMVVMAKLSLSSALQVRALRAVMIRCFVVEADGELATTVSNATTKYAQKAKGISQEQREVLGPPHLHAWNALITLTKNAVKDDSQERRTIDEYVRVSADKKKVAAEVKHIRLTKMYDRSKRRLEVSVRDNTQSSVVFTIMEQVILKDSRELAGMAPPGDLEKQLQTWLDGASASST